LLQGIEHPNCLSIFTEKSQSPLAEIIRTCLAKSVGEQLGDLLIPPGRWKQGITSC
jgi:hypothetical protein